MKLMLFNKDKVKGAAIIGIAAVVVLIAARGTFSLIAMYVSLQKDLAAINYLPAAEADRGGEENFLVRDTDLERQVFDTLTRAAQEAKIDIKQIHPAKISTRNDVTTVTQLVTLEGNFIGILACLEKIHTVSQIKIASLKFELEKRNKTNVLLAHIYFQGVKAK